MRAMPGSLRAMPRRLRRQRAFPTSRSLAFNTERVHNRRMSEGNAKRSARTVLREDFIRDPGSVVRRAIREGSVAIADRDGHVGLVMCIPTDVRPEPESSR